MPVVCIFHNLYIYLYFIWENIKSSSVVQELGYVTDG